MRQGRRVVSDAGGVGGAGQLGGELPRRVKRRAGCDRLASSLNYRFSSANVSGAPVNSISITIDETGAAADVVYKRTRTIINILALDNR